MSLFLFLLALADPTALASSISDDFSSQGNVLSDINALAEVDEKRSIQLPSVIRREKRNARGDVSSHSYDANSRSIDISPLAEIDEKTALQPSFVRQGKRKDLVDTSSLSSDATSPDHVRAAVDAAAAAEAEAEAAAQDLDEADEEHALKPKCFDTNGAATDADGDNCAFYTGAEVSQCGDYDDDDFIAKQMCCECGGGADGLTDEERRAEEKKQNTPKCQGVVDSMNPWCGAYQTVLAWPLFMIVALHLL